MAIYECPHYFKKVSEQVVWTAGDTINKPPERAIVTKIWECIICHETEYYLRPNDKQETKR